MVVRVEVKAELLDWARERSGVDTDDLMHRFPKLSAWGTGDEKPALKQLERFALATHTPVGFLLLSETPEEHIPIPDLRTMGVARLGRPSVDLLDTVFQCQQRQEWYHDFAQASREDPVPFVGSLAVATDVEDAAETIRTALGFEIDDRGPTWSEALRRLAERAEHAGVLVMVSGVVGNIPIGGSTRRSFAASLSPTRWRRSSSSMVLTRRLPRSSHWPTSSLTSGWGSLLFPTPTFDLRQATP